jgi:hypothetical protein
MRAYQIDEKVRKNVRLPEHSSFLSSISYPSTGHKVLGGDRLSRFYEEGIICSPTEVSQKECDERSGGGTSPLITVLGRNAD